MERRNEMKLFCLRYGKGGAYVKDSTGTVAYFGDKQTAKKARDAVGGNLVVSYGVDHKLYKGN
jgi:hypothetical protein